MTLYKWSQTAASDATADPTINWQEGQAPSTVNDSARAMMAATAKYRDDISGAIVTSGSSTAYTVSSYQVFDSLVHLSGQMIAFTPHVTNAATVTLSVDSLTPRPLRTAPGVELLAGTIVQGTPYVATYNNSDSAFFLQSFYGASPYLIPLGASLDFWGATAPSSQFALPYGQAINRTTYAALFALFGTTYGSGDGSATFNIPDVRGRVVAGVDNMGGTAASRLTNSGNGNSGINGASLGATGGAQSEILVNANLPPYTPAGTITNGVISGTVNNFLANASTAGGGGNAGTLSGTVTPTQAASIFSGTTQGGTSTPLVTVQPTIVANRILRII